MSDIQKEQEVRDYVREKYGQLAQASSSCCGPSQTVGAKEGFAENLGYTKDELAALPEGANLGVSCGNPVALASLKPGEVVVDLGSGGGFDCFIAGRKVGAEGRVIGVDMTSDMISKARGGIAKYRELSGFDNVEFRLGEIEHLPVADASADVVISNCVLNLSPAKDQVWRDIGRTLKPGGRVAISDIALLKPLPEAIREDLYALSACFAGAVTIPDMKSQIEAAGLGNVTVVPKEDAGGVWDSYQDPLLDQIRAKMPEGATIGEYAISVNIEATKIGDAVPASGPTDRPAPNTEPVAVGGPSCCS